MRRYRTDGAITRRVEKRNVRRVYTAAMISGDEEQLALVYKYLQGQGWSGVISVDEAIDVLDPRPPGVSGTAEL